PRRHARTPPLLRVLPSSDRRLYLAMLTHPHLDHLVGLPTLIDQYAVGRVLASPAQVDSAAYRAWSDALRATNVPVVPAERGQAIDLGNGARLTVLSPRQTSDPTSLNDASLVARLSIGGVSFLFTGDITAGGESA